MQRRITVGLHIGHDRSVSIVENGRLLAHLAEERVDRKKHSASVAFPRKSLFTLLSYCGLSLEDISAFGLSYAFVEIDKIIPGLAQDLRHQLAMPDILVYGVSHHLSHALSTFYTSPFQEATVFVADGAGDLGSKGGIEAESAYIAGIDGLTHVWSREQDIPSSYADRRTFYRLPYLPEADRDKQISAGRKYEQLTYTLGFGWGQSGKTMGLAPYGSSLFDLPSRAINPKENFDLRMSDLITELDGLQMKAGEPFDVYVNRNRENLAATAQKNIEKIILSMLNNLHTQHPSDNLCLAGGVFLNCVLNHKILTHTPFKNVHIIPASGDDGQSVGAAFHAYQQLHKLDPSHFALSAYLGPSYSQMEIRSELEHIGLQYQYYSDDQLVLRLTNLLQQGKVGGILRGRSEMGPRALGHRSILAAPTLPNIRDHLNHYVKHREEFRPFAPMVAAEAQFRYFSLENASRFMLFTAQLRDEFRSQLPAICHVDGSARVQAVAPEDDAFIHALLLNVGKQSGHPILLNTSFNLAGEPLIETPRDAILCYMRSNLDFLIMESYLIVKNR